MNKSTKRQSVEDYSDAGRRAGIPISDQHASMAANSSDALHDAIALVRSLDYQDHEPCNIFNPVVLDDRIGEGSEQ